MKNKPADLFDYYEMAPIRETFGRTIHGGARSKHHRKVARPLDTKKWIHLALKSEKAEGPYSLFLPRNQSYIEEALKEKAKEFDIQIPEYVNAGNQLHMKIKISTRKNFQKFLKSISALISRHVTGARRGKAFGKFWQGLAYTRILTSKDEEAVFKTFITALREEAAKSKAAREELLTEFNRHVYRERGRQKGLKYSPK